MHWRRSGSLTHNRGFVQGRRFSFFSATNVCRFIAGLDGIVRYVVVEFTTIDMCMCDNGVVITVPEVHRRRFSLINLDNTGDLQALLHSVFPGSMPYLLDILYDCSRL